MPIIEDVLKAGLTTLSDDGQVTFKRYTRVVLADGLVFFVRAGLAGKIDKSITIKGSLHYSLDQRQEFDNNGTVATVNFTSFSKVDDMLEIDPEFMWIATENGIKFAFTGQGNFYDQANLWHYFGESISPILSNHVIDTETDLSNLYSTNSIVFWLSQNSLFQIYAPFLVPNNIKPPYGVASIETKALQAAPWQDKHKSSWQLMQDDVQLQLFGVNHDQAIDFRDSILDSQTVGVMTFGEIKEQQDGAIQSSFNVRANKKTIDFSVSYYQSRIRDLVRQLITSATITTTVNHGNP